MQSDYSANKYCLVDSSGLDLANNILFPYAWDEWMCRQLTNDSPSYIHIWQHPNAFVLGLRDRQLPCIQQAITWLEDQGYAVAVRNSGGSAVPLDAGVVNISLVIPKAYCSLNLRDDFKIMIQLLRDNLSPWTSAIQEGEIIGGYCPGDYDLSINGQKFCGIAQRRQANGSVVSAFVNVAGNSSERARTVRTFYDIASNGEAGVPHPLVDEERMCSLEELVEVISVSGFINSLKNHKSVRVPKSHAEKKLTNKVLFPEDQIIKVIRQLKKRYTID